MTIPTPEILANPGLLKLELMRRGLRVAPATLATLRQDGFGATGHALFESAGDLDLVLPRDTWATVPVTPSLVKASPYRLQAAGDGGHTIAADDYDGPGTRVTVKPPAHFFQHQTSTGVPLGRIGTVHGPYLALSPTNHCQFLNSDDRCRFCGVGMAGTHDAVPVDDIVEAVRVARAEHDVHMVHLSIGYLGDDDGGVRLLEPYVAALKKHFDILVAVDALPPAEDGWIDRTYGMGADAVSYNLEIFDAERFAKVCPGPAKKIGRQRFLDALGYATTVFPSGGVISHLIVGLEPLESTREGIETLTAMGVVPVLPVYRPFKGRDLRADAGVERFEPTLEELGDLYADLYAAVRQHKLGLGLVRDLATVTTPLEGRFFSEDGGKDSLFRSLANKLSGSRFGRRTTARLSGLRRALRVRDVGIVDPF